MARETVDSMELRNSIPTAMEQIHMLKGGFLILMILVCTGSNKVPAGGIQFIIGI